MSDMSDFLAKGISAGLGILKSVASSVICQWYKNNVVIRHRVGRSAWNPEIFVLLKANSTMTIAQMKWDLEIQGAPYTRSTMSSGYGSSGKNLTVNSLNQTKELIQPVDYQLLLPL